MILARDPKQYVIIDSWLWTPGCGGIWETSGRHLGGVWEASGRRLGASEASGSTWGHLEAKCVQTPVFYLSKCRGRPFRVAFGASTSTLIGNLR